MSLIKPILAAILIGSGCTGTAHVSPTTLSTHKHLDGDVGSLIETLYDRQGNKIEERWYSTTNNNDLWQNFFKAGIRQTLRKTKPDRITKFSYLQNGKIIEFHTTNFKPGNRGVPDFISIERNNIDRSVFYLAHDSDADGNFDSINETTYLSRKHFKSTTTYDKNDDGKPDRVEFVEYFDDGRFIQSEDNGADGSIDKICGDIQGLPVGRCLVYDRQDKDGDGNYELLRETMGVQGNMYFGSIQLETTTYDKNDDGKPDTIIKREYKGVRNIITARDWLHSFDYDADGKPDVVTDNVCYYGSKEPDRDVEPCKNK